MRTGLNKFLKSTKESINALSYWALLVVLLVLPAKVWAAVETGVAIPGAPNGGTKFDDFNAYILAVFSFSLKLGVALTTLMLIYAGYKYMTSQGNPTGINEAKDIIVGSLTGFAMLLLIYFILNVIGLPNPG